jgi:methionyl-tRNA formyltransferase
VRLAFLGTPEAAVASLHALVDAGHDVGLVVTRADRRRGRGGALVASPVKRAALDLGLRVTDDLAAVRDSGAERGVVVAYGALIPAPLLAEVPMLNVHFSLLPRWRGAAPVARAILAGDDETGVDVISLEATLDTGPIHAEARVRVGDKTLSELTSELAEVGSRVLVEVLASSQLLAHPRPQVGEATYAAKLDAADYALESSMDVETAARVVRLERSRVVIGARRLRILRAHVGEGAGPTRGEAGDVKMNGALSLAFRDGTLVLDRLQPDGGRAMTSAAWWAGARLEGPLRWEGPITPGRPVGSGA